MTMTDITKKVPAVGDKVYCPINLLEFDVLEPDKYAYMLDVIEVVDVGKKYLFFSALLGGTAPSEYIPLDELGTTFFLTREEAIKAIAQRGGHLREEGDG